MPIGVIDDSGDGGYVGPVSRADTGFLHDANPSDSKRPAELSLHIDRMGI
jgi:hypothetical protein